MVIVWDVMGDFEQVVDTLEDVTLYRSDQQDSPVAVRAWRYSDETTSPLAGGTAVRRIDLVWQVTIQPEVPAPAVGDRIVDVNGDSSLIRSVERLQGGTRYRCEVRRTELASASVELFDLERPIWEETAEGPAITGWQVISAGFSGAVNENAPLAAPAEVELAILVSLPVEPGDQVRRHVGGRYDLIAFRPAAEFGDPSWLELRATDDA